MSRESVDSSSTGDDFVVVNADPKFKLTGDINDLDEEVGAGKFLSPKMAASAATTPEQNGMELEKVEHAIRGSQSADVLIPDASNITGPISHSENMSVMGLGSADAGLNQITASEYMCLYVQPAHEDLD